MEGRLIQKIEEWCGLADSCGHSVNFGLMGKASLIQVNKPRIDWPKIYPYPSNNITGRVSNA